jgi:thioredoxin reductase
MSNRPRIAILGAGPIGLEAALYARTLGYPASVYEATRVGHHLLQWGHVRLFTPWSHNVSSLGERRLKESGHAVPRSATCPTGLEVVSQYLSPLSHLPELEGAIHEGWRAIAISRTGVLKGKGVGDDSRAASPFRLLFETPQGETVVEAEIVLDATGVYGQPNPIGSGGIPALGERGLASLIESGVPDVAGSARSRYEGRRVMVVGSGLSAATTVTALSRLPGTRISWVTRAEGRPVEEIENDPLPDRLALAQEANRLSERSGESLHHLPGASILRLDRAGDGVDVTVRSRGKEISVIVDRIVAQTGFRPDLDLFRELQVHQCYASEGPMKLAALLLGEAAVDCMLQKSFGPESLTNPEPNFFIIGHKSYGRGTRFRLRMGREQVRDVFRLLTGDAALDLDALEASRV